MASYPRSLVVFRGSLLEALRNAGLEVHIACPGLEEDEATRRELEGLGLELHKISMRRTGLNPMADVKTIFSLWRLMRGVSPDYVLAYTIKPVIYGTLAAWLVNTPRRFVLITGLGYAFQNDTGVKSRALLRSLVQRLYAFSLRRSNLAFFQNPDDEALFHRLGIVTGKQRSMVVNGSGIPIDSFSVTPLPAEPRFLMIARLLGDKGVREFVTAAKRIKEQYPDVQCTLVGWIDENPNSIRQEELDEWVESGAIKYLGRLDDVRPAINECSVYVLPSYREGTPRTVLEAMAMGRAVITTDAPGCRETVSDGDNGFLVPVKSVDALVMAMERFISDPDLAVRMGLRSREIAVEKYDVHKVNDVMLKAMGIK